MICPWCSGTGCGSCHGTGEKPNPVAGWRCSECEWHTDDRDCQEATCPKCGMPVEAVEVDEDEDFAPPEEDYEP